MLIRFSTEYSEISSAVLEQLLNLREGYLIDEFDWVIEGRDIQEIDTYLAEDRRGRGIRFDRHLREAVWQLHQTYVQCLAEKAFSSWNRDRSQAARLLWDDPTLYSRYDAVIVDEAQDLTPAGLSVCVELCKNPQGLYLTADSNPSIYNRGLVGTGFTMFCNFGAELRFYGATIAAPRR